jgi:hypothetical protein
MRPGEGVDNLRGRGLKRLLLRPRADVLRGHVDLDVDLPERIRFAEWGEEWLELLERKHSTVRSYEPTIAYACEVFGKKHVRQLRVDDIAGLNRLLKERGMSGSTRAKHPRGLGACLQAAVRREYAARNPVRDLGPSERPRPERKEAAYFTNEEIPRLFAEIPSGLHRTLLLLALKTGMREGEILALEWGDVTSSRSALPSCLFANAPMQQASGSAKTARAVGTPLTETTFRAGTETRSAKTPGLCMPIKRQLGHSFSAPEPQARHSPQPMSGFTVTSSDESPIVPTTSRPRTSGGTRGPAWPRYP